MNFIILKVIHKLSMSPSRVTTISHRPFTAEEWNDIPVSYVNACVITFWVLMAQMWHPVIAHQNTLNELQKLSWKKRLKRLNYWSNPVTVCRLQTNLWFLNIQSFDHHTVTREQQPTFMFCVPPRLWRFSGILLHLTDEIKNNKSPPPQAEAWSFYKLGLKNAVLVGGVFQWL